jgi:RNA polymerase sigma factor (sigma-70 family)
MNAVSAEQENREKFFSAASAYLGPLHDHVRHRIAYLESTGDLVPGELSIEDVVDAALVRGYRQFVKQRPESDMRDWLIRVADEQLQRDVKRLKAERRGTLHIEKDIPEVPPVEEVNSAGDEIFEFYQPDEDLKLEDIFPDQDVSTPEDFVAAKEELVQCINTALNAMPKEWRGALRLRHSRGLTMEELSEVLDKEEPEVEQILEYAREHLRQTLIESGCTFIAKKDNTKKGNPDGR